MTDDIKNHWDELMQQQASNSAHAFTAPEGITWQVAILPGTEQSQITNLDHRGAAPNRSTMGPLLRRHLGKVFGFPTTDITFNDFHPTIPVYLTLQASRLQHHETPIDSYTSGSILSAGTWLQGECMEEGKARAPFGSWKQDNGVVLLRSYPADIGDTGLGIRVPVWG